MALLIPLLLPHVIEAATNIGIGVSNAIQGTDSHVTLQVGSRVFTTRKKFSFMDLPYELRQTIVLMALEMSKDLILPAPHLFDPTQAMTNGRLIELQKRHPLHPDNENYRSIVGDAISANGYPISSWRWMRVSREWRDMLQAALWARFDISGYRPYHNFIRLLENNTELSGLPLIRAIQLQMGFASPSDIYTILAQAGLTALDEISILPNWPITVHPYVEPVSPFPFGLQLVRAKKQLKSLTYGLPLEMTTNEASRQHLRVLAVPSLYLSFARPTLALFEEVKDLVSECTTTLGVRYVTNRISVEPDLLLCEPLQSFNAIILTLHLPRPTQSIVTPMGISHIEDPNSHTITFIKRLLSALEQADDEVQNRYTVYNVTRRDSISAQQRTKIWPINDELEQALLASVESNRSSLHVEKSSSSMEQSNPPSASSTSSLPKRSSEKSQWERQTNLKLLGGLIGLSLESKKY